MEDCCTGREAWSKVSVAFKVALSSCEAEVVSVCQTAQECLGLRHLVEFLENFADMHELERFRQDDITAVKFDQIGSSEGRECYPVLIYSDSQSCLAALQNQGLSRRVRHMSLATCFIQSLVENGHLVLVWIPGKLCVSDLLTKILNRNLTEFHRAQIGILEVTAPKVWQVMTGKELKKNKVTTKKSEQVLDDADVQHDHEPDEVLNEENPLSIFSSTEAVSVGSVNESFERKLNDIEASLKSGKCSHLIVELCTADRSGFSQVVQTGTLQGLCVLAVTEEDDLRSVHLRLEAWIDMILAEFPKVSVMCWFSPPCSGGSPVLNLIANPRRAEIQQRHWNVSRRVRTLFCVVMPSVWNSQRHVHTGTRYRFRRSAGIAGCFAAHCSTDAHIRMRMEPKPNMFFVLRATSSCVNLGHVSVQAIYL